MVTVTIEVGSEIWKNMMEEFGFRRETLKYYGTHFELEELDSKRDFEKINAILNENELKTEFLLYHIYMTSDAFDWKCLQHLSKENLNIFNKINKIK